MGVRGTVSVPGSKSVTNRALLLAGLAGGEARVTGAPPTRDTTLMTGALALLIFSCLMIIVAIDRPFAGMVKLDPRPLTALLEDFGVDATRP